MKEFIFVKSHRDRNIFGEQIMNTDDTYKIEYSTAFNYRIKRFYQGIYLTKC